MLASEFSLGSRVFSLFSLDPTPWTISAMSGCVEPSVGDGHATQYLELRRYPSQGLLHDVASLRRHDRHCARLLGRHRAGELAPGDRLGSQARAADLGAAFAGRVPRLRLRLQWRGAAPAARRLEGFRALPRRAEW